MVTGVVPSLPCFHFYRAEGSALLVDLHRLLICQRLSRHQKNDFRAPNHGRTRRHAHKRKSAAEGLPKTGERLTAVSNDTSTTNIRPHGQNMECSTCQNTYTLAKVYWMLSLVLWLANCGFFVCYVFAALVCFFANCDL